MVTFIPLRLVLAQPNDPYPQKLDEILPIQTLADPYTELTRRDLLRWERDTQRGQAEYVASGQLEADERDLASSEPDYTAL